MKSSIVFPLQDELAIGDVVVAMTTLENDYRNRFSQRPLPAFPGTGPARLQPSRPIWNGPWPTSPI
jgi:hypothetical protein